MPSRSLIRLALLAGATAAALSCGDRSPTGVLPTVAMRKVGYQPWTTGGVQPFTPRGTQPFTPAGNQPSPTGSGLVACSQSYDSVTQVIGPKGGLIVVGPHLLYIGPRALSRTMNITAVAPSGAVRWVRFQPDGLVFQTTRAGWSAILYTSYQDCGLPTGNAPRIAQVSESLSLMTYLDTTGVQNNQVYWSQDNPHVAGLLQHFSNYAVAW